MAYHAELSPCAEARSEHTVTAVPGWATSDLLALWQDRKPDIEYVAQYSGARQSAIREGLT